MHLPQTQGNSNSGTIDFEQCKHKGKENEKEKNYRCRSRSSRIKVECILKIIHYKGKGEKKDLLHKKASLLDLT